MVTANIPLDMAIAPPFRLRLCEFIIPLTDLLRQLATSRATTAAAQAEMPELLTLGIFWKEY